MSNAKLPLNPNEALLFQTNPTHRASKSNESHRFLRRRISNNGETPPDARLTPQKFSWFLRHSVAVAEHMDPCAFVAFDVLQQISGASKSRMLQIIADDQKGRYELRGEEVRAVNGHSVHLCDDYEVLTATDRPEFLYHATNDKALALIMAGALKRMGRHYIHMYDKPPQKTSKRYRILRIRPPQEHMLYKTKNGYIQCRDDIPAEYIEVWS